MASHHEPFRALGPIDWADVPQDGLETFLGGVFAEAQIIIESIPSPTTPTAKLAPAGRARAKTESAVVYADLQKTLSLPTSGTSSADVAAQLRKEWKEVKVNPGSNPLDISVYKLAGKDNKGAWFARRSVHEDLSFDRWKDGLEREFAETMKVQGSPGSGNIRGIGAERNVEQRVVDKAGHLNVFQLSAQFPGPTSPRDFITLLLTCDFASKQSDQPRPLRQYMVVSKPCAHPECPPRSGIIRGQYESVEIIREIPSETSAHKRSFSHADLTMDDNRRVSTTKSLDEAPRAVEWLMVTRSDPGGSVPRFMIEKGTPPGIVGDAGKFLDWVTSTTADDSLARAPGTSNKNGNVKEPATNRPAAGPQKTLADDSSRNKEAEHDEGIPSSNGLYGIITGAFGAATSVANGLRQQLSGPLGFASSHDSLPGTETKPEREDNDDDDDDRSDSDTSSTLSFTSAPERSITQEKGLDSILGSNSEGSRAKQPADKELQKLVERRRKLEENYSKMQERLESKHSGDKEKDAAAMAKVREKHDKELAKQEAKYQREMKKIEDKREQEERKAEARRRKTIEREEKANMTLELDRVKAERDVALKQIELLQGQVGELQAQNTMLVAKLGRMGGISKEHSSPSRAPSIRSNNRLDKTVT